MTQKKVITSVVMDRDVRDKIDAICEQSGAPRSFYVMQAVRDWLACNEKGSIGLPYFGCQPKRVESPNVTEPVLVVPVGTLNKAGT
nr:hypothetical protein [Methylobacterium sp. ZNC0032]